MSPALIAKASQTKTTLICNKKIKINPALLFNGTLHLVVSHTLMSPITTWQPSPLLPTSQS